MAPLHVATLTLIPNNYEVCIECYHVYLDRYCFVQFESYFSASKALAGLNNTAIKGRSVTVDWLLPKEEYKNSKNNDDEKNDEDEY